MMSMYSTSSLYCARAFGSAWIATRPFWGALVMGDSATSKPCLVTLLLLCVICGSRCSISTQSPRVRGNGKIFFIEQLHRVEFWPVFVSGAGIVLLRSRSAVQRSAPKEVYREFWRWRGGRAVIPPCGPMSPAQEGKERARVCTSCNEREIGATPPRYVLHR